jgi:hypothetical protein
MNKGRRGVPPAALAMAIPGFKWRAAIFEPDVATQAPTPRMVAFRAAKVMTTAMAAPYCFK